MSTDTLDLLTLMPVLATDARSAGTDEGTCAICALPVLRGGEQRLGLHLLGRRPGQHGQRAGCRAPPGRIAGREARRLLLTTSAASGAPALKRRRTVGHRRLGTDALRGHQADGGALFHGSIRSSTLEPY